jgi:tetratricopeptide (TPR) repeat protein
LSINRNKILDAARRFQSKGQYDKAIGQYRKLVEADRKDVRSLLKIGDLYVRKGNRGGAIDTYQQVAEHYAKQGFFLKAIAVYKQILKLDSTRLDAQVQLGDMYEQLQLISDAMTVYEDVANSFMRAGDTDQALEMLGKMVELDPDHIPVRIKHAEALSRAGRTQEAADEFLRSAELLKAQGRLEDYVKVAERLLYHRGNDVHVAKELAETYIMRRDPKRALAKLQICFKADPRDVKTLELLAEAFLMLQQTDKAVSVYRETARLHREAQRQQAWMDTLRRILQLDPNDQQTRQLLQTTTARSGEHYMPSGTPRQVSAQPAHGASTTSGSSASGILYVDEEIDEVSDVAALSEEDDLLEEPELLMSEPPAPGPRAVPAAVVVPNLSPMSFSAFASLPMSNTTISSSAAVARAPGLLEQALELADTYLYEGQFEQARNIIAELQQTVPQHPLVADKAEEIEETAAASSGVSAVARPLPEPTPLRPIREAIESERALAGGEMTAPDYELEIGELSPDEIDFVERLAEELAEVADVAPVNEGAQMIDADTVFQQFKMGVEQQVAHDDSATHFDLGIAYKEMGLFGDARREFQVAMSDPRRRCLCWSMIGVCYMEEGQPRDAIEAYRSGLESPHKTTDEEIGLHYEAGAACEAAGLTDQARLHFEHVFHRDPTFRDVEGRLEALGGPSVDGDVEDLLESMDDVNAAFDELIGDEDNV